MKPYEMLSPFKSYDELTDEEKKKFDEIVATIQYEVGVKLLNEYNDYTTNEDKVIADALRASGYGSPKSRFSSAS